MGNYQVSGWAVSGEGLSLAALFIFPLRALITDKLVCRLGSLFCTLRARCGRGYPAGHRTLTTAIASPLTGAISSLSAFG